MHYVARFMQLLALSLLAASMLADRGLGPSPRLFVAGIAIFVAGWAINRRYR
jgi:hypothetical protein